MTDDTVLRLALARQTYESDFHALSEMLKMGGRITNGKLSLCKKEDATYLLVSEGSQFNHLIREYAIHHMLYKFYRQ